MNSIPPEMWESYRRTEYRVGAPLNLTLWVDQKAIGLPDVPWAYITAWNPRSVPQTDAVNRKKQSELEARLNSMDVRHIFCAASDSTQAWPDEEGVVALGLEREVALELGREFDQNAILVGLGEGIVELVQCKNPQK